jgi:V8-like Glu-specific endopeptidase
MGAVLILTVAGSGECRGRDLLWPGIVGDDDRVMADSTEPPWRSVGRFNYAGYREYGFCSGTLVAPDAVVTAAHCFFHPITHRRFELGKFRFALGLKRDRYLDLSGIECVRLHPDFDPKHSRAMDNLYSDVAVAILDKPMHEAPIELGSADTLQPGVSVTHAGYGRDRPYILSVHRDCRILTIDGASALTDCDTNFGQSGGPVLVKQDGTYRLVAVMSGFVHKLASGISGISAWRSLIAAGDCMH